MPISRFKVCIAGLFTALQIVSAQGQTPQLQKAIPPQSLIPVAMSIGGRVSVAPAANLSGLGNEEYVSQWPGSYFQAAFKGNEIYFRVGTNHEILHVVVDGRPPLLLPQPEPGAYRLSGLVEGAHTVGVFVVTESQAEPNHFGGFAVPARERILAPAKQDRQIEFIGDSHTVGYGNTSSKRECTSDEVYATTDNTKAFGPLTANHYRAEYQVNAISGRGIVRNYNGFAGDTLPRAYPYILFDKHQVYKADRWKPQVIVVALGTNDFSTPLNAGEKWKNRDELHSDYEATYVKFLNDLRARNPDAYFILWATDISNGEIASEVQKVTEQVKTKGETKIAFIPVEHLAFTGCHSHPSVADDEAIRDKLVKFIDSQPNIWQKR
jgi:lysophospholipase L1-like esterase